jgi:hypothetical protein
LMAIAHVEVSPILMACRRTNYLRNGFHKVGRVRQIHLRKAMALTRGLLPAVGESFDQFLIPKPVTEERMGRGSCKRSPITLNTQLPPAYACAPPDCVWETRNQELAPPLMRDIAKHGSLLGSGVAPGPAWGAQPGLVAQASRQEPPALLGCGGFNCRGDNMWGSLGIHGDQANHTTTTRTPLSLLLALMQMHVPPPLGLWNS